MPENKQRYGESRRRPVQQVLVHILLVAGAIAFLFPFVWMVLTSLKPLAETTRIPPTWLPSKWHWENYRDAVTVIPFWTYARNTLIVCVLSVMGTLISSTLVAYGFARISWRGRDIVFIAVLATMVIPFPILMAPLFVVFSKMHLVGTLTPLWLPAFGASAFNIFLLRQFFMGIPNDLIEAARMDGLSELGILVRIVVPLSKPALLVVALFQFIFSWNDFLGPLVYLTRQETYTLSLGLQFFQSQHGGTQWHHLMAASTLIILPVVVLYFFAQRYFVEGISLTGLKG